MDGLHNDEHYQILKHPDSETPHALGSKTSPNVTYRIERVQIISSACSTPWHLGSVESVRRNSSTSQGVAVLEGDTNSLWHARNARPQHHKERGNFVRSRGAVTIDGKPRGLSSVRIAGL